MKNNSSFTTGGRAIEDKLPKKKPQGLSTMNGQGRDPRVYRKKLRELITRVKLFFLKHSCPNDERSRA
jgi:hypothetical protein